MDDTKRFAEQALRAVERMRTKILSLTNDELIGRGAVETISDLTLIMAYIRVRDLGWPEVKDEDQTT